MLTCSLRSIRDNFVQQTLSVVPIDLPKDLFSCKIHQGKIAKTYRVLVANLATNFLILVARAVILVALATVLGAISCPVSFLQMVAYLSRYISNFSSQCEPLRKLTKVNAKFEWLTEQEKAFKDLKAAITTAPVLIPYHPERETLIICDGSPAGLGGGLFQKTGKEFQPVHCVSRTLTDTEKRYSQIEREALAAEFTTTRLQMYLLGAPKFKLATDHKPLIPLLHNPTAKLPPRIERLA